MSFGALVGERDPGAQQGRGDGRLRPRHRRGRAVAVPPRARRRPGVGDRHRLLRRPHRRRRLRRRRVRATSRRTTSVKCVSLKLSQGAKPGIGGVLPGREGHAGDRRHPRVPQGEKCVSPPSHTGLLHPGRAHRVHRHGCASSPAASRPGSSCASGSRVDVLAMCKAMLEVGTTPDFIIVDGSEGGTGAAPLEYEDHVGMPLTDGLMTVHNALVGAGLRDRVRIGASGKVAAGNDIVKRLIQGADYTNSARAMMMAVGCIQAQSCHTDTCPVGVTTQDPSRSARARRGRQEPSGSSATSEAHRRPRPCSMMASMGVADPADQHDPTMLRRSSRPPEPRVLRRALRLARARPAAGRAARGLGGRLGRSPAPTPSSPTRRVIHHQGRRTHEPPSPSPSSRPSPTTA